MRFGFEHSYFTLSPRFYESVRPAVVADPRLVVFNRELAADIGLGPQAEAIERNAAAMLSGKELPEDANPIAMAYAGHQFGGFAPRLGDGRAILLGEVKGPDGVLRDVQLKGAGLTPFSRGGDGRAAIGPMLREYLISEAMHALGIPTTRSLAVVTTGERVFREDVLPGAVLTRVAASHIRVGTFQYFAARGDQESLRELLAYVIARHYPLAGEAEVPALAVLTAVAERQAALISKWMQVGFIHGVMNTDNMAISGETIDYGPCAFMDKYDPKTVFSSIDHGGRYAYVNQPAIAQWNLARLAEALLPLIDPDSDKAVGLATGVLESFMERFDAHFLEGMCRKIGLVSARPGDADLVNRLLATLQNDGADFTLAFRRLAFEAEVAGHQAGQTGETGQAGQMGERGQGGPIGQAGEAGRAAAAGHAAATEFRGLFGQSSGIDDWLRAWRERLALDPQSGAERASGMRSVNPAFIPRNHRVEAALNAASVDGDYQLFYRLLGILQHPYDDQPDAADYSLPPAPSETVFKTFCGT